MTLTDAFGIKNREVISLVGGGGKTALMFALGRELSSRLKGTILTTTTKIWDPTPSPDFGLFLSDQVSEIKKWVTKSLGAYPFLLVATRRLESGKIQGVAPSWVEEIHSLPGVSVIVVEADGAAGRSLKAPREGEPVLPASTTLLIPIVGVDVLDHPLDEEHVFRAEIAARLLNISKGIPVTKEIIAGLLLEIIKGRPKGARVIPFINKVDLPGGLEKGKELAKVLLSLGQIQMEKVVLGQAQNSPVVKEIVWSASG